MAQIVVRQTDILEDENQGDVLSIYEDDVELSGAGYASCAIIQIPGVTAAEIMEEVKQHVLETRTHTDGTCAWKDGITWRDIKKHMRHRINLSGFRPEDMAVIESQNPKDVKRALWSRIKHCIKLHNENQSPSFKAPINE